MILLQVFFTILATMIPLWIVTFFVDCEPDEQSEPGLYCCMKVGTWLSPVFVMAYVLFMNWLWRLGP